MSTSSASLPSIASRRVRRRARSLAWPPPELVGLLALAAVLYLWSLDRNGFANQYYSAAVRSMTESWHAFLFGSFDPSGVMTVDKPPLALWVQALSARIFGFGSWSILVPQALMGVAGVALTWDLTRRRFGRAAGFAAGLALALTPIAVAISRHNNPDALMVLCVIAAVWCLVRGLDDGRTRWLVLSGVCVGLGFEAKMGAALLVVPAIVAAWMWVAPRGRLTAMRQLAVSGAAMAAVGLAWPVLVWLTPASDRPWVAGTSDNSIWSLIFGYNGLGRLFGQSGAPGGAGPGGGGPGGGPGGAGGRGGGGVWRRPGRAAAAQPEPGRAGRLAAGVRARGRRGVLVATRLRRGDPRTGWLIVVGGSFLTTAVAFSQAKGIFHPYYVSQLAPFSAALVGAGVGQIGAGGRTARIVGPLAVVAGIATELAVLGKNPGQLAWVPPLLIVVGGVAAVALGLGGTLTRRLRTGALVAAIAVLLLAPASWAVQTIGHATGGTFPAGGPASAGFGGGPGGPGGGPRGLRGGPGALPQGGGAPGAGGGLAPGGLGAAQGPPGFGGRAAVGPGGGAGGPGGGGLFGGNTQSLNQAVAYARQHGGGTLAVSSQSGAASQLIGSSGANVAAIGGFSGRESQVSVSWLADAVAHGRIRWVLTDGSGGGMFRDGRIGSSKVMAAVEQTCARVDLSGSTANGTSSSSGVLYDCHGHAGDLRALAS